MKLNTATPIRLDFIDIRKNRQLLNNKLVYESIKKGDSRSFDKSINKKQLERTLTYLDISKENFFDKCRKDNIFCKLASQNLSKKRSKR